MSLIHVYFYAPNESDHVLNHIVTRYSPPFSHCDVQFQDGMASSVYQGERVYWKKRGFKKPGYSRITLSVSKEDYDKAYAMCKNRFEKNYDFDKLGMFMLPLPSFLQVERPGFTFCSKHCTEVLQAAKVRAVDGLAAKSMTPSTLHDALRKTSVLHTDCINLRIANK
jgi:hypothetical protein